MATSTQPATKAGDEFTYGSYLRVPELLTLQQPASVHDDELHFIVIHQAQELWFKLVLADVERVVEALERDDFLTVLRVMRRVNHVIKVLVDQLWTLNDLPPWSLHEFRSYLGSASGLQSIQFREFEILSGLRDEAHMSILRRLADGEIPPELTPRLAQRSFCDAHLAAGARQSIVAWEDLYTRAADYGDFYLVTEALMDYDQLWLHWRRTHVTLIERILGPATRGSSGMALSYLLRTTEYRFFPHLWSLRHDLAVRGGGELVNPRTEGA
jgi:tryptophan 2,3-dioxygenase